MLLFFCYLILIQVSYSSAENPFNSRTGLPADSNSFRQIVELKDASQQSKRTLQGISYRTNLNADAKIHPTACISLDSIDSLRSVQCMLETDSQLVLTFSSELDARFVYSKWIISSAQYVNGGQQWGCKNRTTKQAMVITQQLTSFQLNHEQIIMKVLSDSNISPLVCFGDFSMHYTWELSNLMKPGQTDEQSKGNPAHQSKSLFSSWSFVPQQPSNGQVAYPGNTITVSWTFSNMAGSTTLKITLYKKGFLLGTSISSIKTRIDSLKVSFTIPNSIQTSSNDKYYFVFAFTPSWIEQKVEGSIFYIPTAPSIIPKSPPNVDDVFYPGDSIPLSWDSANFASTSTITIRFRRARPIIPDATLATFTVLATANAYNFMIPSSIDRADNDKYYYFEFDYCTSWLSFNCKKSTNSFFIPRRPFILPTFPSVGKSFAPSQLVTLTWNSANFAKPTDIVTIKLRRYKFLLPDSDIDTFTCTVGSSGSCSRVLPTGEKSLNDYYFEFNWCKHFYSTDCKAQSNRFSIPTHFVGSWNFDQQKGRAISPKTLYAENCTTMCPTRDDNLLNTCKLCNKGRKMGIELTCANCWATYDYTIIQMDMIRKEGSPSLDRLTISINSSVTVNADFTLRADYRRNFQQWLPLPSIPILPTMPPIRIGSISIDVGLSYSPSIAWDITMDAIGNISVGADYQWQSNLTFICTPGNTTKQYSQSLKRNNHPIQGDFQANMIVDLTYRPALALTFGILTIELGTDLFLIIESAWQYPAFSPLPSIIFDWNTKEIAPIHQSFPANACINSHFIRYHTKCGVRNTQISLQIIHISDIVKVFTKYELSISTRSFFNLGPFELSSGCIKIDSTNTYSSQTKYLIFNRPYNAAIDNTDRYLPMAVVSDLSTALSVLQTRIYYKGTASFQQGQMTIATITFLPASAFSTNDPSVSELVQRFQDQVLNSKSLLYSGIVTSLTNLQQTSSVNKFSSVSTAVGR